MKKFYVMIHVIKHDMDPNSNINYRRKIPPWTHKIKSLWGFHFMKTKHKAAVQNLSIWRKVFLLFCFSQVSIDMEVNEASSIHGKIQF